MIPTFHATCVTIEDTAAGLQIGLANVYIERNEQGYSMYGGVTRCDLLPGRFLVILDDKGSNVMQGLREMEITFVASAEKLLTLGAALRRCFDGFCQYSENLTEASQEHGR